MADPPISALSARLQSWTQARVGLGRTGQSLPTSAVLDFDLAHARARDAVDTELSVEEVEHALGRALIEVRSRAGDRTTYIQRPDLGRQLDDGDRQRLTQGRYDAALIIGDGLSATAAHRHAAPVLLALIERLAGWMLAPLIIARYARVALGDEIGAALGADLALILIGERPGLSAPDSLGAYLTWSPRAGRRDSERNCVSNIRPPHGLGYAEAADRIAWLMHAARDRRLTGIALKEDARSTPASVAGPPDHSCCGALSTSAITEDQK